LLPIEPEAEKIDLDFRGIDATVHLHQTHHLYKIDESTERDCLLLLKN
jgi:hypothetical protein